jgi:hypothetical protein
MPHSGTGKLKPLKDFIKLDTEERKLKTRLKVIKAEKVGLQEEVMHTFEQMEATNWRHISGVTVYLKRDIWVGKANDDVTGEALAVALRNVDLGGFVRTEGMNIQSISGYLREQVKESTEIEPADLRELLPMALRPLVKISDNLIVSTRKT